MCSNNLRQLRGPHSLSAVANKIGITPQMLGAIERGIRNPSLTLAKKISDYYGVSVDFIFFAQTGNKSCLKENTGTEG